MRSDNKPAIPIELFRLKLFVQIQDGEIGRFKSQQKSQIDANISNIHDRDFTPTKEEGDELTRLRRYKKQMLLFSPVKILELQKKRKWGQLNKTIIPSDWTSKIIIIRLWVSRDTKTLRQMNKFSPYDSYYTIMTGNFLSAPQIFFFPYWWSSRTLQTSGLCVIIVKYIKGYTLCKVYNCGKLVIVFSKVSLKFSV